MYYEEILKAINDGNLAAARTLCRQGIETETARTTKGVGEATRIKNIFKLAKRVGTFNTWIEPMIDTMWSIRKGFGEDKLCICDGFVGYILPVIDGIETSDRKKSFSLLDEALKVHMQSECDYVTEYTTLAHLKSVLKQFKADKSNKDKTCLIPINKTWYKVEQLIEAYGVLGIKDTHIYAPANAELQPLSITTKNGDVIIMPCRPPKA